MLQVAFAIVLLLGTQQDQPEVVCDPARDVCVEGWNDFEVNGDVYTYSGQAFSVTYQDLRVLADFVSYDRSAHTLTADRIHYTRDDEVIDADHGVINIETKVGDFTKVRGEVSGFFIAADEAHRDADGIYHLKNATVTTCCDGPRRGWTASFASVKIKPDERLTARGSIFRLEGVPVFYLPYVTLPTAEKSRATGFLFPPSTSTSTTRGRSVRESFYWGINRSADATISAEYFTKRGVAGDINFRAVPSRNSSIQVQSMFARDRLGQGGRSARIFASGDLGGNFRGVAEMNLVSSFVFRQVYEDGLNLISSPLQHSLAFASRNDRRMSTNFVYARDAVFFVDQPTVALRKFPTMELGFPAMRVGKLPLYFSGESSVTSMARRDADVTTPMFVQRFDFRSALEMPVVQSSAFSWSQRVGFRETAYTHSRQDQIILGRSLNRTSFEYGSTITGPQLQRDFGNWRHVIEPAIETKYVGGANDFRNTIVVDNVDLVTHTNEIQYAVTNRFFTNREIFSWRIAQKYFFDPTFGGAIIPGRRNVFAPLLDLSGFAFADGLRRFSPVVSNMRLSTSASTSTDIQVDYDTRDHLFRSAGIAGNANRGQFNGGISYFVTRRNDLEIPNNQVRGLVSYGNQYKPGFSAAFGFSYDVKRSVLQSSTGQVGYNMNCFGLSLEFSQFNLLYRVENRFRFSFTLKDIGSVGTLRPNERLF